jgi:hypothetical protein
LGVEDHSGIEIDVRKVVYGSPQIMIKPRRFTLRIQLINDPHARRAAVLTGAKEVAFGIKNNPRPQQ